MRGLNMESLKPSQVAVILVTKPTIPEDQDDFVEEMEDRYRYAKKAFDEYCNGNPDKYTIRELERWINYLVPIETTGRLNDLYSQLGGDIAGLYYDLGRKESEQFPVPERTIVDDTYRTTMVDLLSKGDSSKIPGFKDRVKQVAAAKMGMNFDDYSMQLENDQNEYWRLMQERNRQIENCQAGD